MSKNLAQRLGKLRTFVCACGFPSYLDNGFVDLIEVEVELDEASLEEVIFQVNDFLKGSEDELEQYPEAHLLPSRDQCFGYRIVGDPSGALTRYKKAAAEGARLLMDFPGIVPCDERLELSDVDAWAHAVYSWLGLDAVAKRMMSGGLLCTVDLRDGQDEGLGEVNVYRWALPDTAIRSSVLAIDWLLQLLGEPLKIGTMEWHICKVLSDGRSLHREAIQSELPGGDSSDGMAKGTLSALVKSQVLGKRPGRKGYFLTDRGKIALATAEESRTRRRRPGR